MFLSILLAVAISVSGAEPNIVRPCQLHDLKCIQNNLASSSQCTRDVVGSIPTTFVPTFPFEYPQLNTSYIDKDLVMQNMDNCVPSEFLFNIDTKQVVLAIDCFYVKYVAYRTVYEHRSQLRDQVYGYNIQVTYPFLRLTSTMSFGDRLDFCNGFGTAEVPVPPTVYSNSKDKLNSNFLAREWSDEFIQQSTNARTHPIMNWFLKHKLCDFGCHELSNLARPF